MFNIKRLQEILINYKQDFVQLQWPKEKYKWEAYTIFKIIGIFMQQILQACFLKRSQRLAIF